MWFSCDVRPSSEMFEKIQISSLVHERAIFLLNLYEKQTLIFSVQLLHDCWWWGESEIIINRETNARVHLELWIETEPPKSSLCLQVSLIMQKKWLSALEMPYACHHTTSFSLLVVSLSCCCWLTLGKPLIGVRYSRAHDDDVRSKALCRRWLLDRNEK